MASRTDHRALTTSSLLPSGPLNCLNPASVKAGKWPENAGIVAIPLDGRTDGRSQVWNIHTWGWLRRLSAGGDSTACLTTLSKSG